MMSASLWWVPAALPAHSQKDAAIRPTAVKGNKYFFKRL
jgi:hypothetical protein